MKATAKRQPKPPQPPRLTTTPHSSPPSAPTDSGSSSSGHAAVATASAPSSSTATVSTIKAAVRVRPLVESEATAAAASQADAGDAIRVVTAAGKLTRPLQAAYALEVVQPHAHQHGSAPGFGTGRRGAAGREAGPAGSPPLASKAYAFDYCAGPSTTQEELFTLLEIPSLCDAALAGQVVTVFCFGQTGSGKTYTLSGRTFSEEERQRRDGQDGVSVAEDGLQYRAVAYVARRLREMRHTAKKMRKAAAAPSSSSVPPTAVGVRVTAKCSYVELYQETLYDLLQPDSEEAVRCRWSAAAQAFYVEGSLVVSCQSHEDFLMVLREGQRNRQRGSHALNHDSSRSHVVFTIFFETETDAADGGGGGDGATNHTEARGEGEKRFGRLVFVDLAGSERLKKSQSASGAETGSINRSLFTLGRVLELLSSSSSSSSSHSNDVAVAPKPTAAFIPYRSSILTQLLMQSLDGHGRTLMVACVSPSSLHLEESMRTLHYAQRARHIETRPVVHVDAATQQRMALEERVRALERENALLRSALCLPGVGSGGPSATPLTEAEVEAQVEALHRAWAATQLQRGRTEVCSLQSPLLPPPPSGTASKGPQGKRAALASLASAAAPPCRPKPQVGGGRKKTAAAAPPPSSSPPLPSSSSSLSPPLSSPLAQQEAPDVSAPVDVQVGDRTGTGGGGAGVNILALLDALPDTRLMPSQ